MGANASASNCRQHHPPQLSLFGMRGGASSKSRKNQDSYKLLALSIQDRIPGEEDVDLDKLERTLASLSSAQKALKGLDGAAHEAYARTHNEESLDTSVSGRARRSAARAGCTADGLLAAELCELLEQPELLSGEEANSETGTLAEREILLNMTSVKMTKDVNITVLVLYEPSYGGGAGMEHGGIEDLAGSSCSSKIRGRLLVIVRDDVATDLPKTCAILDADPLEVELRTGLVANEIASVQGTLYRTAGRLLTTLEPTLREYNQTAVHFVGRSLAGGVASLAAAIFDGTLPMPQDPKAKRGKTKRRKPAAEAVTNEEGADKNETQVESLDGLGRGRSSAMVLGAPPCLSANVKAAFVKSIMYGDDVVCRTSAESLERLYSRVKRGLKGGFIGRQMGWMTDTVSLTMSSLKTHAHGSEGEEARLVVPGQAFLVRPRRLGGVCTMHEIGSSKGGREALRAAVLWQLHDVLLSKSLWKHHQLESYIHGLDRVQLRGFESSDDVEDFY